MIQQSSLTYLVLEDELGVLVGHGDQVAGGQGDDDEDGDGRVQLHHVDPPVQPCGK